jgi:phosphonate transport system substrate-binding protein
LKRDKGLRTSYDPAARRTFEHIRLKEQIMRKRRNFVLAALVVVLALAFTSRIGKAAGDPIRVGMIPDAGATQVSVEQKKPLKDYLESAMGQPVELIIPTNYNATVEALGNGSLDFAYLGGLTYLKAHAQYGVTPLVQRQSDQQFHSLFITGAGSSIQSLADLKGKNFAFGDINSTSGHLMPYFALRNAGISVDSDLKFRYTGSHPATAKAVEAGAADAGALDETVFHQVTSNGDVDPSRVRVFFTTPPFVDYVWVARKDVNPALAERFAKAFLSLQQPKDAQVLDILRGTQFVRANDDEYNTLRSVAKQLGMLQ